MYISGLVNTLVTHATMKVFGLASFFGARPWYMPPDLKTKQKKYVNKPASLRDQKIS